MNEQADIPTPPCSVDDEKKLICALMLDRRHFDEISELVEAESFYDGQNRIIYAAIVQMVREKRPIKDLTIVADYLKLNGQFEDAGGSAHLYEIATSGAMATYTRYYASIVSRHAKLRAIIETANIMRETAYRQIAPEEILDAAEGSLAAISTSAFGQRLVTSEDAVLAAMDRIDAIMARTRTAGIFTGLTEFDDKIGGLFSGELNILAARSGVGKTALGSQIVCQNAGRGRLCYVASLEMDASELATRMVCSAAGVDSRRIRTNRLTSEDLDAIRETSRKVAGHAIRFDERPRLTVADIRRVTRRLLKEDLKLVVVDYLQILTPADPRENRERQVADMSQDLKALARELKVPVLVLCQSNRDAEKDKTASLRHLRESDAIGQNADVVLMLECGAIGTPKEREAWLTIAKNRNGPRGKMQLDWFPETTRFRCHSDQKEF